ncbi:hypothetical protein QQF64_012481 [Cirrhinus molitorella]|uniref:Uncharacterized protein n=1 Tax=Cirrhinus molitorella TaxID=172907 RepID=A0ABR3LY15_9TELE
MSITSAKPLNTDGLRRLSVWLQGRVRRDVHSLSERSESDSAASLTQKNSNTESFVPQHRSVRVKRTEPNYSVKRVERAGYQLKGLRTAAETFPSNLLALTFQDPSTKGIKEQPVNTSAH